jgi:hypothetical protein
VSQLIWGFADDMQGADAIPYIQGSH